MRKGGGFELLMSSPRWGSTEALTLVDIQVKSRLAYHVNRERLHAWVRFAHHSERSNK